MTIMRSKAFFGMGQPHLDYSPLPSRIYPESIMPAGPVTLLHRPPHEGKAIPAIKIGDAVKTGQKLALHGNGDYVTSSVTGSISALTPFSASFGRSYTAVAITPAPGEVLDDTFFGARTSPSPATIDFLNAVPGGLRLQRLLNSDRPIRTLVVNGVDQDLLVVTQQYALSTREQTSRPASRYCNRSPQSRRWSFSPARRLSKALATSSAA